MSEGISKLPPLEQLKELRFNFSDEIPSRIVHSNDPDNKFKVRKNWFQGVVANVANALEDGQISTQEGKVAAEQLLKRFTAEEFVDQKLTTPVDINEANRLIDVILEKQS